MDTAVRAGKIVYSQACWLLALNDFCSLLSRFGRTGKSDRLMHLADKTIHGVEQKLWSEQDACYLDIQESPHTETLQNTNPRCVILLDCDFTKHIQR